jgi:hypothetical protein
MRAACVAGILAAACGRIGFDAIGDAPSDVANVAFVTSSRHTGDLGGLAGADAICAARAAEAGLPGTFIAWLGTTAFPAWSRLAGSRGWRRVDGTAFADNRDDLVTSAPLAPLVLDELGNDARDVPMTFAWSGMRADGSTEPISNCLDWTSAAPTDQANVGLPSAGGPGYISETGAACDQLGALYCVEIGHVASVDISRARGRYAFVSAASWVPNARGIASADEECSSDATRAGLPGSYRAYLPSSLAPADRFDRSGPPWIRTDGALLARTASDFFADRRRNFVDRTAEGTHVPSVSVWGGIPNVAGDVCAAWTARQATTPATSGRTMLTDSRFFQNGVVGCDDVAQHLLCLQR